MHGEYESQHSGMQNEEPAHGVKELLTRRKDYCNEDQGQGAGGCKRATNA
jgi:hypothetical protein